MAKEVTIQDAKPAITNIVKGVFSDYVKPQMHFTSMLGSEITDTELMSWSTEDFKEKESTDVDSSTQGQSNIFSTFREYIIKAADYKEFFDIQELQTGIIGANGNGSMSNTQLNALLNNVEKKTYLLKDKIYRAVERKSADLLNTGILTYKHAGTFNFGRKSASMVDLGAANYFTNASASFRAMVLSDREYFREEASLSVTDLKYTISTEVWEHIQKTTEFKEELSKSIIEFTQYTQSVSRPDMNTAHYEGSYRVSGVTAHIWTYNGKSQGAVNGTDTWSPYMDVSKIVAVPGDGVVGAVVNFPLKTVVTSKYGKTIDWMDHPDGFATNEILDTNAKVWRGTCEARKVPALLQKDRVRTTKGIA